ncbi:XrtA-associated tyrosine autokinase [Thauera butanivorans]|uniref:XrtA-associated tyrosine autokinase n=1 Tax=Thauera butanivorans TaxID=86174 RepID=UPI003AB3A8EC
MSLIEKAAQRLDQLKQASGESASELPAQPSAVDKPEAETAAIRSSEVPKAAAGHAFSRVVSRVAQIDLQRLHSLGLVTPDHPRSSIAEEYRVIKRPLLRNATATGAAKIDDGNLIMVTSALPGEGKTFNAVNLAISMAMELDYTVLLVDADVSRPSVLRQLGLPPEKGLMDVLAGDVTDLSEVLMRTNIEKLSILPAGMPHQRATELLASDAMTRLLEQMASRYPDRIIVFDSPPLLVTTESRVLATHMGQIVVVVEAERTTHATVKQALSTIESCPIKLMVLNKSRGQGADSIYGYGYGYGYGDALREQAA